MDLCVKDINANYQNVMIIKAIIGATNVMIINIFYIDLVRDI
jgi:hypothetical protein